MQHSHAQPNSKRNSHANSNTVTQPVAITNGYAIAEPRTSELAALLQFANAKAMIFHEVLGDR